jgi:hypothetical protein
LIRSPSSQETDTGEYIHFYVTGQDGTEGFCRILIPRDLLNGTYTVLVDGEQVVATELPESNESHTYLYFAYDHSIRGVTIIPEFPTTILTLLFLAVTTCTVLALERRCGPASLKQ